MSLDNMTNCPHCGKPMKVVAAYCPHCGKKDSIEVDEIFTDEFLNSIPLEDHLKTKPIQEVYDSIDSDSNWSGWGVVCVRCGSKNLSGKHPKHDMWKCHNCGYTNIKPTKSDKVRTPK